MNHYIGSYLNPDSEGVSFLKFDLDHDHFHVTQAVTASHTPSFDEISSQIQDLSEGHQETFILCNYRTVLKNYILNRCPSVKIQTTKIEDLTESLLLLKRLFSQKRLTMAPEAEPVKQSLHNFKSFRPNGGDSLLIYSLLYSIPWLESRLTESEV